MNRRTLGLGLAMIVMASTAFAQDGGATFTSDLLTDFERASDKIVQLAEAMPEEKYSWRPAEGVRSVSEVFIEVDLGRPERAGQAPEDTEAATSRKHILALRKTTRARLRSKACLGWSLTAQSEV